MKIKLLSISVIIVCSHLFCSCQDDVNGITDTTCQSTIIKPTNSEIDETNLSFSKILAFAMEDQEIREFIKKEALKETDNDFDVIYHLIKDEMMSNGSTFRENLANYCSSLSYLDDITNKDYTLSILVPYLNDTFNAEQWNVKTQIPVIAYRNQNIDKQVTQINIFDSQGNNSFTDRYKKPDFPVLVVKSNERLISTNDMSNNQLRSVSTNSSLANKNGIFAYFLDDTFNKINEEPNLKSNRVDVKFSSKLYSSYFFNENCVRDYIYYGISPSLNVNEGPIDTDYREYITSIEFNSPAGLSEVNDLDNPTADADWSDGNLEICFDFLFISRDAFIVSLTKMASIRISDLFISSGNREGETSRERENGRISTASSTRQYSFSTPIEIFQWDTYSFGNTYKIVMSEYDPGNGIEITHSLTSDIGTNFELKTDKTPNGIWKVGAEFDSTPIQTVQSTTTINCTDNSDLLGEVLVNFSDPIFTNQEMPVLIDPYFEGIQTNETGAGAMVMVKKGDFMSFIQKLKNEGSSWDQYFNMFDPTQSGHHYVISEERNKFYKDKFINYKYKTKSVTIGIEPRYIYNIYK